MSKSRYVWMKRLGLVKLIRLATEHASTEAGEAALAYALDELMVVEVEHRMVAGERALGFSSRSSIANAGESRSPTFDRASRVEIAAEHLERTNPWRPLALELLAQVSERQQRAALINAFLIPRAGIGSRSLQMLPTHEATEPENQRKIYQVLGWHPNGKLLFKDSDALRNAAWTAKKKMRAALLDKLVTAALA
ncbi:hypothetical protein [Halomonas sp. E14]|uniref:hypothetical protein n=1 Tax=Halomonas sp. E14 TaxID=3397245 RepID=UPI00403E8AE7